MKRNPRPPVLQLKAGDCSCRNLNCPLECPPNRGTPHLPAAKGGNVDAGRLCRRAERAALLPHVQGKTDSIPSFVVGKHRLLMGKLGNRVFPAPQDTNTCIY